MTPRPQLLPAAGRHAYMPMPGAIANYCGGPEVVLTLYCPLRERLGSAPAASDIVLPTHDFVATRVVTDTILKFLTPEVIVAQ